MAFRTAKVESANQIGFRIGFRNNLVQSRNERKRLGFSVVSLRIRSRYQYPHGCTGATEWFRQSFQLAPDAAADRGSPSHEWDFGGRDLFARWRAGSGLEDIDHFGCNRTSSGLDVRAAHGRQINGLSQAVIYGPWSPKRSRQ
jgi:hypothetical protein